MNRQEILTGLQTCGLEESTSRIYLFLLEHGPSTHLELSRGTNIDRSKVYRAAEKLQNLKLIEESHSERGKKLQAASPNNLMLLLELTEEKILSQKQSLPELIQELRSIPTYIQREFEIKHYRGQEGLRQMLWNQLHAKKEILAFSHKNKNDMVGKPYAEKIRAEQIDRQVMLYEIENETDQGDFWYTDVYNWGKFYQSRYINPAVLEIKQYIAIFNDTVAIINWSNGEEIGVEIINHSYAQMQKQLFWKFWEIAKEQK